MSGGSFGYLYQHHWEGAPAYPGRYEEMAEVMDRWPDARARLLEIVRLQREALKIHEELADVMQAVEWLHSSDWGEDSVDRAVKEWRKK